MSNTLLNSSIKIFVETHGCQMNVYDSDKMFAVINDSMPATKTLAMEEADIILINTCSIREKAQEKVFSELGRYRALKEKRPDILIGVGGCVASQEGEAILQRAPYVDVVFGPQTLHRLPELLKQRRQSTKPIVDISFPEIEKFDRLPEPKADGPTAYVSIMEGCSKYCTYCIVPYTRGEEISRPLDDVLAEVYSLAEQNVKEVTLLGQNVNDYRGPMHNGEIADLALLIRYVAAIDGIERIRFTTSHPWAFDDNLIRAYAEEPKLANHLHLPVQSGSNRILGMMKRNYTVEQYLEKIEQLKKVRPNITISSDFIVGFPTETTEDFQATMDLIQAVHFDNSFSFIYSPRPGTPAAKLVDNVTVEEKKQRLAILQSRIIQNTQSISQNMVDSIQQVLITGASKKNANEISGRTENNRVVNLVGSPEYVGKIIPVKISAARAYSLRGELC